MTACSHRRGASGNSLDKNVAAGALAIRIETIADDDEARVLDERLASRLGYANIKDFRALIRRYRKFLNQINVLREVTLNPDPVRGGRPGTAFYLTEAQAVFIVGKAGTSDADSIFVEISRAFVAYRRGAFPTGAYGAIVRDLLLPAPRDWEQEFSEAFWTELHRVGNWRRPAGNNHSNCAHFINEFVYGYLLGSLGLNALRSANPRLGSGDRAHKHHQMLKDKHLARLRQHVNTVTVLLRSSVSLQHFEEQFARNFQDANRQIGLLLGELPPANIH